MAKDPRFQRDAYLFVREALDFTQKNVVKENREPVRSPAGQEEKHVTGQELLEGIRGLALKEFGPMTITVFEEWGVRSCGDFGEIVFNMVNTGWLKKTEKDTRDDFQDGYDFKEAFRNPFLSAKRLNSEVKTASN